MTILGVQILGILFALVMFYITFLNQKKKLFTTKESIIWFAAWVMFFLLVLFPTMLDFLISDLLDFSRRMDFFIVLGFMFVIGMVFHIYTIVRRNQKRIDRLVSKIAIENKKKE